MVTLMLLFMLFFVAMPLTVFVGFPLFGVLMFAALAFFTLVIVVGMVAPLFGIPV